MRKTVVIYIFILVFIHSMVGCQNNNDTEEHLTQGDYLNSDETISIEQIPNTIAEDKEYTLLQIEQLLSTERPSFFSLHSTNDFEIENHIIMAHRDNAILLGNEIDMNTIQCNNNTVVYARINGLYSNDDLVFGTYNPYNSFIETLPYELWKTNISGEPELVHETVINHYLSPIYDRLYYINADYELHMNLGDYDIILAENVLDFVVSNNCEYLIYVNDSELRLIDPMNNNNQLLSNRNIIPLIVSNDGKRIYFSILDREIHDSLIDNNANGIIGCIDYSVNSDGDVYYTETIGRDPFLYSTITGDALYIASSKNASVFIPKDGFIKVNDEKIRTPALLYSCDRISNNRAYNRVLWGFSVYSLLLEDLSRFYYSATNEGWLNDIFLFDNGNSTLIQSRVFGGDFNNTTNQLIYGLTNYVFLQTKEYQITDRIEMNINAIDSLRSNGTYTYFKSESINGEGLYDYYRILPDTTVEFLCTGYDTNQTLNVSPNNTYIICVSELDKDTNRNTITLLNTLTNDVSVFTNIYEFAYDSLNNQGQFYYLKPISGEFHPFELYWFNGSESVLVYDGIASHLYLHNR